MWLGERRGHVADWLTQCWVRLTGRRTRIEDAPWLAGPCGSVRGIGADFFRSWGEAQGLTALPSRPDDGLLPGLEALRGPGFDPFVVHPLIHAFYARTAAFDLRLESRWSRPFRPVGWLLARLFARRLGQLHMPLRDDELEGGVDSRIVRLADDRGVVRHTAWVRGSTQSGRPVFVGEYGITRIPGHVGPCVKVVFPLPNGNAVVVLRPRADPGGGLSLVSDGRGFGGPGFYFTVLDGPGVVRARYVRTMKERLGLRVDGDGLVAQHRFRVFGLPFLELTYRIRPKPPEAGDRLVAQAPPRTDTGAPAT